MEAKGEGKKQFGRECEVGKNAGDSSTIIRLG